MFGYVKPDLPYLYMKDDTLYKALYCGVCKSIGGTCGQCARFSLTYDIAFMSAIVHNLKGEDVKIKRAHCIIHPVTKRPIADRDDITDTLACLNVILAYYKAVDNVRDEGRGRLAKLFFGGAFKRAKKAYPELDRIVCDNYRKLYELEQSGETSVDKTADPFAVMIASISDELLRDRANAITYSFFYNFGKWIYLIDALDDYDKDVKRKCFNPFYSAYKAKDFHSLKCENGEEISFIMGAALSEISRTISEMRFSFNADLIRNIAVRGTTETTKRILSGKKPSKEI